MFADNLSELLPDAQAVRWQSPMSRQCLSVFVLLTALGKMVRCFGQEDESNDKRHSPKHLKDDWNPIFFIIVSVMSSVVDNSYE